MLLVIVTVYASVAAVMIGVAASASGGTGGNYGVLNNSSSPAMTNVTPAR